MVSWQKLARSAPPRPSTWTSIRLLLLALAAPAPAASSGVPLGSMANAAAAPEAAAAQGALLGSAGVRLPVHHADEPDWDEMDPQDVLGWRVYIPVAACSVEAASSKDYRLGTVVGVDDGDAAADDDELTFDDFFFAVDLEASGAHPEGQIELSGGQIRGETRHGDHGKRIVARPPPGEQAASGGASSSQSSEPTQQRGRGRAAGSSGRGRGRGRGRGGSAAASGGAAAKPKLRRDWEYAEFDPATGPPAGAPKKPAHTWGGLLGAELQQAADDVKRRCDAAEDPLPHVDPMVFFHATMPPEAMRLWYDETVRWSTQLNAEGKRNFDWNKRGVGGSLEFNEMYPFLAILKIMLLRPQRCVRSYWKQGGPRYCKEIAEIMTLMRFEAMLYCCHFANNETDRPKDSAGNPKPASELDADEKNWAIQKFQSLLEAGWQRAVAMPQDLAMDESGIKHKGKRDGRNQRNIAKPARYFLKVFGLAAGATVQALRGYLFKMSVYGGAGDRADGRAAACEDADDAGAEEPADAAAAAEADAAKVSYVMRLVRALPSMHYKGHVVYTDNYYGCEALLEELSRLGVHLVCTAAESAVSHKFSRKEIGVYGPTAKKAGEPRYAAAVEQGQFRMAHAVFELEPEDATQSVASEQAFFFAWKDNSKKKDVVGLSSFLDAAEGEVMRRQKQEFEDPQTGQKYRKGEKAPKRAPGQIVAYTPNYGGLDSTDMALAALLWRHCCRDPKRPRQYMVVWRGLMAYSDNNGWRLLRVVLSYYLPIERMPTTDDYLEMLWPALLKYAAEELGWVSKRRRGGRPRRHVFKLNATDEDVLQHTYVEWWEGPANKQPLCYRCGRRAKQKCPGCSARAGCDVYLCNTAANQCLKAHHQGLMRKRAAGGEGGGEGGGDGDNSDGGGSGDGADGDGDDGDDGGDTPLFSDDEEEEEEEEDPEEEEMAEEEARPQPPPSRRGLRRTRGTCGDDASPARSGVARAEIEKENEVLQESQGPKKRPRGRAPAGKMWDVAAGAWVPMPPPSAAADTTVPRRGLAQVETAQRDLGQLLEAVDLRDAASALCMDMR